METTNSICYKVFCCNGDFDYYFYWLCPTCYELCATFIYKEELSNMDYTNPTGF